MCTTSFEKEWVRRRRVFVSRVCCVCVGGAFICGGERVLCLWEAAVHLGWFAPADGAASASQTAHTVSLHF